MRQLVTIRTVSELIPIEGADVIQLAKLNGWQCVVKKGDFCVGDLGLYFEIDSLIPSDDERFAFLNRGKVKSHYRIKSMKLRGALSQGLLMPLDIMTQEECSRWCWSSQPEVDISLFRFVPHQLSSDQSLGETLAEIMSVQKYEAPVPIDGVQKGNFPTRLVPKTDQERIQNMPRALDGCFAGEFEITEKLDGTSCTMFYFSQPSILVPQSEHNPCFGVCSRNWEMKLDDDNIYAKLWHELELHSKLIALGRNLAIQGEIIGPKIQGNKYKRGAQEFYVFGIYDIDEKRYLKPSERWGLTRRLGLLHVPHVTTKSSFPLTLDVVLDFAEDKSDLFDTQREGLVFKSIDNELNFKVISNRFLLKHD